MKKEYFVGITLFLFAIFFNGTILAQGATCEDADPFCAGGSQYVFPNTTGVPTVGSPACLFSAPNPTWFYLQVDQMGDLEFSISQSTQGFDQNGNPLGTLLDVDFVAWGPFSTSNGNCDNLDDCSGNCPSNT
nr:hypothetical protein [Flavobacteriales bacterium]